MFITGLVGVVCFAGGAFAYRQVGAKVEAAVKAFFAKPPVTPGQGG